MVIVFFLKISGAFDVFDGAEFIIMEIQSDFTNVWKSSL